MRLVPTRSTRSHRPFDGTGASLYVGVADPTAIAFRNLRAWPVRGRFTAFGGSKIGGTNTQKTARVASVSDPTSSIDYTLPVGLASQSVFVQVRTYKDDAENESNWRPARVDLNGSLVDVTSIIGSANLLSQQQLAGGIVRLRFQYFPSRYGIQPLLFRAMRTAGPTSPAAVTVDYVPANASGAQLYEVDTPALSDSAPYTYKIRAENASTTVDLLTGITVNAVTDGPSAPGGGGSSPW